jgi:hypothetical protein
LGERRPDCRRVFVKSLRIVNRVIGNNVTRHENLLSNRFSRLIISMPESVQQEASLQEEKRSNEGKMVQSSVQSSRWTGALFLCHNVVCNVKKNFPPYARLNNLAAWK